MARALWSGSISFGLVMVPVKVYSAVSRKDVRFNQLHAKDGGRVQQKRQCSVCGEEVAFDEIVKGYEIEPGRYVEVTPEELDSLSPEKTHRIEIEEFVELASIDPIHWESTYHLAPEKAAQKPYALLSAAIRESGRVGLGRVVLRSKEYLAAIRPVDDRLMLSTMLFHDELVPPETVGDAPAEVKLEPRELSIAKQLVESLAGEWDPDKYRDTYRDRVLELISNKAEGRQVVEPAPVQPTARVDDLMAALEASLAAAKQKAVGEAKAKPKAKPRVAKKS